MHTGNNNNEFSYEMNGKVLDKVLIEKDLGIMISYSIWTWYSDNEMYGVIELAT